MITNYFPSENKVLMIVCAGPRIQIPAIEKQEFSGSADNSL